MLNILIHCSGILSSEQIYILAYNLIPKQKSGYIKYLKKQNKTQLTQEKNEENINSNNDELNINLFEI
jgi:hypothetical protein